CAACRSKVTFARELAAKARMLRAPDPSGDLISRVIAERRDGQRVILPVTEPRERSRQISIPFVATAALVAAAAIGFVYLRSTHPTTQRAATVQDSTSLVRDFLGATIFLPNAAAAAEVPPDVRPFKRPAQFDGRKLKPVLLTYERQWTPVAGSKKITASGTLRVSRVEQGDFWKIERDWTGTHDEKGIGQVQHEVETALLSGRDLRLISREIHVTPYRRYARINVSQLFVGDSVTGRMTTEGGDSRGVGRPVSGTLDRKFAPVITDAIAPVVMRAVGLNPNWSGSLSILGWAVRKEDLLYPITLRVIGSERVTVPAGTFDCWKMSITVEHHDIATWMRKSDGIAVRTRDDARGTRGGIRDIVLVAENKLSK
ncbi:MAG TPA: hypothetical protein VM099_14380, partial [Gemmatimonadaceae bacterium]|nr:hypothetical protein [Gemmatimonadaceae bacterium]